MVDGPLASRAEGDHPMQRQSWTMNDEAGEAEAPVCAGVSSDSSGQQLDEPPAPVRRRRVRAGPRRWTAKGDRVRTLRGGVIGRLSRAAGLVPGRAVRVVCDRNCKRPDDDVLDRADGVLCDGLRIATNESRKMSIRSRLILQLGLAGGPSPTPIIDPAKPDSG
jgi:hypothetical protein